MHQSGDADLGDLQWRQRRSDGSQAYANSKLFDLVLTLAIARLWPHVLSNAVDPGIAPTKMAGASAPGDLEPGAASQVWLAMQRGAWSESDRPMFLPEADSTGSRDGIGRHRTRRVLGRL